MADLMKSASGKLVKTSGGNLRLWSPAPQWHVVGASTTSYGGHYEINPPSTKFNINDNPLSSVYPSARSAAMSALAPGGYWPSAGDAAVGAAYGRGGAARADASVGGVVLSFVPPAVSTAARVAVSGTCQLGVFTSLPSGSQLLSAMQFSPSGGYVDLEIFLDIINNRAEALKGLQDAQIALANNTAEYEAQSLTVKSIETDMEAIEVRLNDIDNIIRNTLGEVTDKLYEAEDIQSRLIKQAEEWMAALSKAEEEAAHVKMEEPAMSIVDKLNASVPLNPVFQPVQGVSDTQTSITNNFNLTGMIVREEADIPRIARELYIMQQMGANGG